MAEFVIEVADARDRVLVQTEATSEDLRSLRMTAGMDDSGDGAPRW
jgi:hypothetical protein